ncbi:hypothetical protein [Pseudarthrobacter sp. fls2-241-R2A-127]
MRCHWPGTARSPRRPRPRWYAPRRSGGRLPRRGPAGWWRRRPLRQRR